MYWNVIFVYDPWTTELHEMNEKCFRRLNLGFRMILWCFNPVNKHPPLSVRENCPFWQSRNGQTMDSDYWFWRLSVTIFKRFVGTSF